MLATNFVYTSLRVTAGESGLNSGTVIDIATSTVGEMADDLADRCGGFGLLGRAAIESARKTLMTAVNNWLKKAFKEAVGEAA
jgi:hypothetical protein